MAIKVHVEGLAEVQAALRELPDATAKNVLRRVGRKRLEPVANKARELVPVDQGHLRASIGVSTKLTRRQRGKHTKDGIDDVEVYVGASKFAGALPHAHLQEFGTEHHGPQPFLRPAWDSEKDGVLAGIKQDLWEEIEKAATRIARKAARAAAKAAG